MTKYLHTMIRVSSLEDTIAFFEMLGLQEISLTRPAGQSPGLARSPNNR
jgi:catechol 2,3-dioxygenase-like lactoylglutathione lyase family enzyme